jgi:hypothetical protein
MSSVIFPTIEKQRRVKTSLTIRQDLRSQMGQQKNKSRLVNAALDMYFSYQTYMQEAKQVRLSKLAEE